METEERPEPAVEEPPETPEPIVEPDKEPGGNSPEDVYARREYRTRKKVEAELQQERIEKIRLEERLRAIEAQKNEKPVERIYTRAEVRALVKEGKLDSTIAQDYIDTIVHPAELKAVLDAKDAEAAKLAPIQNARAKIAEYVKLVPGLGDQSSGEFTKAATEYNDLISQGYPDDDRTRVLAIKLAHGDLTMLEKKAAMHDLNRNPPKLPVDPSGGGGNGAKAGSFDSAPADLKNYWQKSGMTKPEQERHFKKWQERQKK